MVNSKPNMTFLIKRRTPISFKERLSSKPKNTQISYQTALNNFENFCQSVFRHSKEEVIKEFLENQVDRYIIFDTLQDWINWNIKKGRNSSSLRTWFSYINSYLYYRGLELTSRDIKQNLDFPKKLHEELYPLSTDEIKKILVVANFYYKSIILAQLSSLMREGELLQIRKKHLEFVGERIAVHIPAAFTKLRRARTTFISTEASKMIRSKLFKLDDEDLVWSKIDDVDKATHNYESALGRYCTKVGLEMIYESNGRRKITSHSFRAFGITKISRHDPNFAKMLAGQKGYLLQYDRLTDEEKLELYKKIESDLAINDSERKQCEIEKLQKEKQEHAKATDQRVTILEKDIEEMKMLLRRKESIKEIQN